jgi:PTS system nitrogen regulatory IIA component
MSMTALVPLDAIVPELQGRDAAAIFAEMCAPLESRIGVPSAELQAALAEREALAPTTLGHGVAIPHGVHPGLQRVVAVLGRSRSGVDFAAPDGEPVRLFVVLLRPPDAANAHLKALARVSRVLIDPNRRAALLGADDANAMARAFVTEP